MFSKQEMLHIRNELICYVTVYLGIDAKESSMFHLFLNDVSAAKWMAFFEDLWIFGDCKHVT